MKNKVLITGINGQDGSYLTEFLLNKGYEVHGTLKRNSISENQTTRLDNVYDEINLHYADMTDLSSLYGVIQKVKPSEIYNLAAQSHVRISFDQPIYTANATGLGTLNVLGILSFPQPCSCQCHTTPYMLEDSNQLLTFAGSAAMKVNTQLVNGRTLKNSYQILQF